MPNSLNDTEYAQHCRWATINQAIADRERKDRRVFCASQSAAHHRAALARRELRRAGLRRTWPAINLRAQRAA